MEQKTINQNKLQTILCIIALTLGVLVSAVLFSTPTVHAAELTEWFLSTNTADKTIDVINETDTRIRFYADDTSFFMLTYLLAVFLAFRNSFCLISLICQKNLLPRVVFPWKHIPIMLKKILGLFRVRKMVVLTSIIIQTCLT